MTQSANMFCIWSKNIPPQAKVENNRYIPIEINGVAVFLRIRWHLKRKRYEADIIKITGRHKYTKIKLVLETSEYFLLKRRLDSLGVRHRRRIEWANKPRKPDQMQQHIHNLLSPTYVRHQTGT